MIPLKSLVVLFTIFCCVFAGNINVQESSSSLCQVCQLLVGFVEGEVVNKDIPSIEKYLATVCDVLPSSIQSQCRSIVSKYTKELVTFILNSESPSVACRQLSLCSNLAVFDKIESMMRELHPQDNNLCNECQSAIFFVKLYLTSNATIGQIEAIAKSICQSLTGNNYQQCLAIFNIGLKYIINFIENNDPKTICTALKLCQSRTPVSLMFPELPGSQCSLCELTVGLAEQELVSPQFQETIIQFAQKICDLVPSNYKQQCISGIAEAVPQLISQLVSRYPPAALCTLIGVCPNTLQTVQLRLL